MLESTLVLVTDPELLGGPESWAADLIRDTIQQVTGADHILLVTPTLAREGYNDEFDAAMEVLADWLELRIDVSWPCDDGYVAYYGDERAKMLLNFEVFPLEYFAELEQRADLRPFNMQRACCELLCLHGGEPEHPESPDGGSATTVLDVLESDFTVVIGMTPGEENDAEYPDSIRVITGDGVRVFRTKKVVVGQD